MLSRSQSKLRDVPWSKNQFQSCLFSKRRRTRDIDFILSRYASSSSSTRPPSSDDVSLIPFFDQPQNRRQRLSFKHTGLFRHRGLTTPSSFEALAEGTLKRAQHLTDRILAASSSRHELFMVVKNLDKLSDMLCGVIDMAEFVRNSHPDQE